MNSRTKRDLIRGKYFTRTARQRWRTWRWSRPRVQLRYVSGRINYCAACGVITGIALSVGYVVMKWIQLNSKREKTKAVGEVGPEIAPEIRDLAREWAASNYI